MIERLTAEQVAILKPAIKARLSMPDDCDGCFSPLGNDLRRRIVSYGVDKDGKLITAGYHFQHEICFDSGVPVRRRL